MSKIDIFVNDEAKFRKGGLRGGFANGIKPSVAVEALLKEFAPQYSSLADLISQFKLNNESELKSVHFTDGIFVFTVYLDGRPVFTWRAGILDEVKHDEAVKNSLALLKALCRKNLLGHTWGALFAYDSAAFRTYRIIYLEKDDSIIYVTFSKGFKNLACFDKYKNDDGGLLLTFRYDDVDNREISSHSHLIKPRAGEISRYAPDCFVLVLQSKYTSEKFNQRALIVHKIVGKQSFYRVFFGHSYYLLMSGEYRHELLGMIFAEKTLDRALGKLQELLDSRGFSIVDFGKFKEAVELSAAQAEEDK